MWLDKLVLSCLIILLALLLYGMPTVEKMTKDSFRIFCFLTTLSFFSFIVSILLWIWFSAFLT